MFTANFKDPIDNGINAQSIIFPVSDRIYRILIQTICNNKKMLMDIKITLSRRFFICQIKIFLMHF